MRTILVCLIFVFIYHLSHSVFCMVLLSEVFLGLVGEKSWSVQARKWEHPEESRLTCNLSFLFPWEWGRPGL